MVFAHRQRNGCPAIVQWDFWCMPKNAEAIVLLAEGFEEIEAITIIDTLRRAQVETLVAAVGNSLQVLGGHGITVTADCLLAEIKDEKPRLVVLPGGGTGVKNIAASDAAKRLTSTAREVAAICAAPSALAQWQLLSGKTATSYPGFEDKLRGAGAKVSEERVVVDGNLTTSRGPGTALEFALQLVENLRGREARERLAAQMLVA
jgi:4-methyl-5(b-hydroxyethyl)-thiazole monophosphate biosynthesis